MAKNTLSSAFRKIDVDQFNDDGYNDEDSNAIDGDSDCTSEQDHKVSDLLANGCHGEALKMCLCNSLVGNRSQQDKDAALSLTMRVLLSTKQNNVDSAIDQLDYDQKDMLMKYIYKGFECPSEGSSAQLLMWHEKVFQSAGIGSIVRVMTDRKKV